MRWKRIYLNERRTKYCIVKIYSSKEEMRDAIKKTSINPRDYTHTLGLHRAYTRLIFKPGRRAKMLPETGTVFLCKEHCGAGIATHEILHAILWGHKHKKGKIQYPFVIKSMKEEEEILMNFTYAVRQFYSWYWKIENFLWEPQK